MSVRDATEQVRGEWRHAVATSNVDTKPLSEYEQPLPIHERDSGLSCQRDADKNVTDTTVWVRRTMATRPHTVKNGRGATLIHEQPLPIRERDAGRVVPASRPASRHGCGGAGAWGVASR